MYHLRMYPHPILDEANHLDERIVTFDNGLPETDPDCVKVTLRAKLLPHGHIKIDALEIYDGITFRLLRKYLALEAAVRACWIEAVEGIWLRLDGRDVSSAVRACWKPFLTDFVTDIARFFGRTLVWEDDIDEEKEDEG